eukprot:TRINITY_DN68356_c0_g1_i4.p1 TRINITY_DN68356_c0_g1~~TRINITY_DN68356_c0_g1_i4.p1  ORF type:complete len:143 (+),score=29.14 TRINITY_DN68356_c0_g1_i4:119-547(+)
MCIRDRYQRRVHGVTYGLLIKAYSQNGMLPQALRLFEEMLIHHIPRNQIIYGQILHACIESGEYQKAVEISEQMEKEQIPKNIIIYTIQMKGYAKQSSVHQAWQLFTSIADDRIVKPNSIFYNETIDTMFKCKHPDLSLIHI